MASVLVLLGGLLALIVALVVRLQLKARRRTENFDGQEIERQAREAIRHTRANNTSAAVHNRFLEAVAAAARDRPSRRPARGRHRDSIPVVLPTPARGHTEEVRPITAVSGWVLTSRDCVVGPV
ncbi:hypothetical protein ACFUNF_00900 [Streptomyces sp. NPDC057291]|uniref:hypothetical protein n=1 Tax=Streptomyces sp. NPDC057291 TaxID=3346087 RepID=UPI003627C45B